MHRSERLAAPAAQPYVFPCIATVEALGLAAIVRFRPSGAVADSVEYIAHLPDGRLRFGFLRMSPNGRIPVPGGPCDPGTVFATPLGPDGMAAILMEAANAGRSPHVQGLFGGWDPWSRRAPSASDGGGDPDQAGEGDRSPGWEKRRNDKALLAAWDAVLAPRLTAVDLEAAALSAFGGHVRFDVLDALREKGPTGEARRTFAKANPALADAVLGDARLRSLVDAGRTLREVLAAMSAGSNVLDPAYPNRPMPKKGLLAMSGRSLPPSIPYSDLAYVLSAAGSLPLDWLPMTEEEASIFVDLCRTACMACGRVSFHGVSEVGDRDWWRTAFSGASGRWRRYADRITDACSPVRAGDVRHLHPGYEVYDRVLADVDELGHFHRDIVAPLALIHDARNVLDLACRPGDPGRQWQAGSQLFAERALVRGMSLPAIADMGRRHREARPGIRAVVRGYAREPEMRMRVASMPPHVSRHLCTLPDGRAIAFNRIEAGPYPEVEYKPRRDARPRQAHLVFHGGDPSRAWCLPYALYGGGDPPPPEEVEAATLARWGTPEAILDAVTEGRGMPVLGLHPIEHHPAAGWDTSSPQAAEAMLDAWRRVLPRRWRHLGGRELAMALDEEAKAFAETI